MHLYLLLADLEQIAPLAHAEPWDNVGLLTGDPAQSISRILLTIDYTAAVAAEGRNLNCDLIISYHPPLFSPVKRITADGPAALIHDAIRRGVAIYSPHTAWDVAPGGTNDFLADSMGLIDVNPLKFNAAGATHLKFITFVPEKDLETVAAALFAAGAGQIGNYSSCSFRTPGVGTFLGEEGTHPTVGTAGKLESQPEIRLETVMPISKSDAVVAALIQSHPYEEPAYDLSVLAAPPSTTGQGRIGKLPVPVSTIAIIERVKKELGLHHLLFSGNDDKPMQKLAICAGAGGELLDAAIAAKADLFLTGELRHHDAIKAAHAGVATICTLHSNCERPSLTRLKARLEQLPDCPPVVLSQRDRDPFSIR